MYDHVFIIFLFFQTLLPILWFASNLLLYFELAPIFVSYSALKLTNCTLKSGGMQINVDLTI